MTKEIDFNLEHVIPNRHCICFLFFLCSVCIGSAHFLWFTNCFVFSFLQSGKAHQVSQFHIVNWNTDGSCANLKTITDVIEEVTKVQMRSGNNPIVVHCR